MTSTPIYQGMDSGSKPSSRVLAPPGGGSSNIFGAPSPVHVAPKREPPPPQPAPPLTTTESSKSERNIRAAPKQGEDSFQTLFGSTKDLGSDISTQSQHEMKSEIDSCRNTNGNESSPSTFDTLFGESDSKARMSSASTRQGNSFNTLFGDQKGNGNDRDIKEFESPKHKLKNLSINDTPTYNPQSKSQSRDELDSSFHRVFGEFPGDSTPSRTKRQSDCSYAYNPITGETTDEAEAKQKQQRRPQEPAAANGAEKEEEEEKVEKPAPVTATAKPAPADDCKEKTSTRIAQPPGGKSSGPLW